MPTILSDADLLAHLVGFDTTSHNSNLPLADFVADYLDRPGVEVVRNSSEDGAKANLLVFVGATRDEAPEAGLVLSGHMDVVPALEPEWRSDPFELGDGGDRWFGRGSSDMKGFVALAVNRAARLDPASLTDPLALVLTYDEEVGTLGAHRLRDTWPVQEGARALPQAAIIGEPTSLEVVRMHKGHLQMRIALTGVPAHSGYPHLGMSSIEPAAKVIRALARLRRTLEEERPANHRFFPQVPFPALNVGTVRGGSAVNVVPEHCEVEVGARVLPGMDSEELAARIEEAAREAMAGEKTEVEIEVVNISPPVVVDEDAPICACAYRAVGQTETASASYATDAGWLQDLGLDCIIWGPGSIEVAHKPNEFMPKDEFQRGGALLDRVIDQFCRP